MKIQLKLAAILILATTLSFTFTACDGGGGADAAGNSVITIAAIPGVIVPVRAAVPVTTPIDTEQYTGTVTWSPEDNLFAEATVYTAHIVLTAKSGWTLAGVPANFFTVAGATATNAANSGNVVAVFAATGNVLDTPVTLNSVTQVGGTSGTLTTTGLQLSFDVDPTTLTASNITVTGATKGALTGTGTTRDLAISNITVDNGATVSVTVTSPSGFAMYGSPQSTVVYKVQSITIAALPGVVIPVRAATPVTTAINTAQYTGTVTWTPGDNPFAEATVYTAHIVLTAKSGWTLTGVPANFFTVEGATATNAVNTGNVAAVFAKTGLASDTAVAFSGLTQTGGEEKGYFVDETVTTTGLQLTFDVDPTTLTASNIFVTGATKGALTGTGTTRDLAISNITVAHGGTVSVTVTNPAGFAITGSPQTAVVYRYTPSAPNVSAYELGALSGISGVTVFYPSNIASYPGTLKVVTLSGGFTNVKEDMYWIANYLSGNGIIVFALSASNNLLVSGYENAHWACYNLIVSENGNAGSPIAGKVGKIGLIGFSMGGGAVLDVNQDLPGKFNAVIALAPYSPDSDLSASTAHTLIMVGNEDTVAPATTYSEPAYGHLPATIKKGCAIYDDFAHTFSNTDPEDQGPAEVMMLAWLKYVMDGDESSLSTLMTPPSRITYYGENFF